MKTILLLILMSLSVPMGSAGQTTEAKQAPSRTNLPPQKLFTLRVDAVEHREYMFLRIDPPYKVCEEKSNDIIIKGVGEFYRHPLATEHAIAYGYQLRPDTITGKDSEIHGAISVVGVLDREKANCPTLAEAFPPVNVVEGTSNEALQRQQEVGLPTEKEFSQHFSETLDSNIATRNGIFVVKVGAPYVTCKETRNNIVVTGGAIIQRGNVEQHEVDYPYWLVRDVSTQKPTTITGDVTIMGIVGSKKSQCPKFNEAFKPYGELGEAYSWQRSEVYASTGSNFTSNSMIAKVHAPPGELYCKHYIIEFNHVGNTSIDLKKFTTSEMWVMGTAYPTSGQGSSIGIALLVEYLPHPELEKTCTPPLQFNNLRRRSNADGSLEYFNP